MLIFQKTEWIRSGELDKQSITCKGFKLGINYSTSEDYPMFVDVSSKQQSFVWLEIWLIMNRIEWYFESMQLSLCIAESR